MSGFLYSEKPFGFKYRFLTSVKKVFRRFLATDYIEMLRQQGAKIGNNVFLDNVKIDINFAPLLEIKDNVSIAFGSQIWMHDAALNNIFGLPIKTGKIIIHKGATIGANVVIFCGVEIGENAVIGACSLVTRDIPANTFAYGIPAEVKGTLEDLKKTFIDKIQSNNPRFKYFDILPWRDRIKRFSNEEIQKQISDFCQQKWS
ncbi:MAG: hypothetical protein A2161_01165 [Candidatus Schekmanbacteria bacterium RBG_13_48_7]|uniref:Acetyltransferase n=1 Tax=Candidatus Schekmanbacteria bacterium RBG_13_48_7 TaxID=1817878 RepID=A0A1F7RNA5_9BACT|nr:MAG: hypothetical protein A2161_01165 [Candidatus Schekmanbacteria bacterium RBG_13_48_7]